MSNTEHWYERPWRTTQAGTRSALSAVLYFVVGLGAILTAITADDAARRVFWLAIGVAFVVLGATLVATLRLRRKP